MGNSARQLWEPRLRPVRRRPVPGGRLLLVVLGICASTAFFQWGELPDSGRAGPGRAQVPVAREPLRVSPAGPRVDASVEEIVTGFLQAGAGFADDHATARTFLRGTAARNWIPTRKAVIYPDDSSLRLTTSGSGERRSVVLRVAVWGHLSPAGELELAPPGEQSEQRMSVIRVGSSWRIEELSDQIGLWMPRYEFDRSFLPIQINFAAITGATLVPDLRWFARTGPGLPTTIMRTLLNGPPAYLRFAVTSGAPSGTSLGLDAVPISDGVARVDLSENALKASTEQRTALWSQIAATLGQLPSVQQVQITVGGLPFPLRREKGPISVENASGEPADVRAGPNFALTGNSLARIDVPGAQLSPDIGTRFSIPPKLSRTRSIAIPNSLDAIIRISEPEKTSRGPVTRLIFQTSDRPARELGRAADLIRPAVDPAGWVWTADRQRPGSLLIAATDSAAKPGFRQVRADWLSGRKVQALDISRDGSRIVLCSRDATGVSRIDVAGVSRRMKGEPQALDQRRTIGRTLPPAIDLSWADRITVAVLVDPSTGPRQAHEIEVGGLLRQLPAVPGAAQDEPTALWASDSREVFLVTEKNQLLVRSGGSWQRLGTAAAVALAP